MAKTQKKNSKKSSSKRFATIGLWFGLAALVSVGLALVIKLFIFMGLYSPPDQEWTNLWIWISLGVLLVGPAMFALLDPQRVRDLLTGRQARYGSNAFIMLVAFLGIIFVVNLIVYQNPVQKDLTEDQSHTLAPETLDTLEALPGKVKAIAFYTARTSNVTAEELLNNFKINSKGNFDYEFQDPDQDPALARQYEIARDGTIILVLEDRYEVVSYASEKEITAALIRLINPGERTVYFLTGHSEHDPQGSDETAYSLARQVLESKKYTVTSLNLLDENQIPEDALAIIIAGPLKPITEQEAELLGTYLAEGGSVVFLWEPSLLLNVSTRKDAFVEYLGQTWGISFNDDFVIDPTTNYPEVAFGYNYFAHPITEKLLDYVYFPSARSLVIQPDLGEITISTLVTTVDRAWGETDFGSFSSGVSFDNTEDTLGPITLAVAAENTSTTGRLVVFSDSEFASDTYFGQYANGDFLINAIDWAAEQESQIGLTPKTPITRQLNPLSNISLLLLALSFVCVLPGLVVVGGIMSWLARRRRG